MTGRARALAPAALALWWALAPLLKAWAPGWFFPSWGSAAVLGLGAAGFLAFAAWALVLHLRASSRRRKALDLIRSLLARRSPLADPTENDVILAGRVVARLVRNADEDLREIGPDFTPQSLRRLERYLPELLDEAGDELDAWIRLGIVGTYLGETLCRGGQWRWFFKPDPALRQFSYTPSVVRRGDGRELDPYAWAGALFAREKGADGLLEEAR